MMGWLQFLRGEARLRITGAVPQDCLNAFNGEGLESRSVSGLEIATSTVSTINTDGGINTSLAYAEFSNDVFNGDDTATWVLTDFLQISGHQIAFGSINGTNVLTWH